jgi:3',5'-cyclic AMP phosphodiesterase CpdA
MEPESFVRTAIISDIHGNLTALEAVLNDLRITAPDLILHGGDLADNGSSPVEAIDMLQSSGWQGVVGNTDEMLSTPATFEEFAAQLPALETIWAPSREMAAFTRDLLGADRLAWLRGLPKTQVHGAVALVHASPESRWRSLYAGLGRRIGASLLGCARTDRRLRPHPHALYPAPEALAASGQMHRKLGKRRSITRWRPPCGLFVARRRGAYHSS